MLIICYHFIAVPVNTHMIFTTKFAVGPMIQNVSFFEARIANTPTVMLGALVKTTMFWIVKSYLA